jgi:hypothetical protein
MEQRRDTRTEADQPAWITIYGNVDTRVPGRVRNFSGRGIGIQIAQPVASGSALKIEIADSMLFGEVIYCRPEGHQYYIGVELDQAVNGLMALSRSVRDFNEALGLEKAHTMNHADREHQQQTC